MKATLTLSDGTTIRGKSFGAETNVAGEVVFNTGMVGYPETFTDPSYKGQILVLTYPLIGNYGVPDRETKQNLQAHFESDKIHIKGLIISDISDEKSHWNAKEALHEWLKKHNIPALHDIDTRALTQKLRSKGVMLGKIEINNKIGFEDPNKKNLVAEVSCKEPMTYKGGYTRILLIDCGAKNNIIRSLLDRNVTVIRVPWNHDISKMTYDGILISNGPGDPKMCKQTIKQIKWAMKQKKPIFGICMGNQILALAAGANTYKLKYGHRSQNQPCIEVGTKRCYITTQNHGYAVDAKRLPKGWEEWFRNANDGTNEGIRHKTLPFFSVQFHPEATPGPTEAAYLFDRFLEVVERWRE